jgi:histidyl-tRNA synthetase
MGRKPRDEKVTASEEVAPRKTVKREPIQLVRGMKDILPSEWKYWDYIYHTADKVAMTFGFDRIETPVLEFTNLFIRGVGEGTDIVSKELYSFVDRAKNDLSLRPEPTAGVVRAYIEHGMFNMPQPVKLFTYGPVFRHEKPQAGRYRQFHQLDFEVLGEKNPVMDAQIIQLAWRIYRALGLKDLAVQINSLGCRECRPRYITAIREYFDLHENKLSKESKERLKANPLRLLDSKEEKVMRLVQDAPQILDFLDEDCHNHLKNVLEYLDELEIPYELNPRLVRGLDYYSKTVFEVWTKKAGGSSALGGGGRYDYLVEDLGGRPTPAVGFGAGIERIILELQEQNVEIKRVKKADVFLGQLGEMAKKKSLKVFEELRDAGVDIVEALGKNSIKSQLKVADKLRVKLTLILGQKEAIDGTIIIRDMVSGIQEIVDITKVVKEVQKRLEKHVSFQTGDVKVETPKPENFEPIGEEPEME